MKQGVTKPVSVVIGSSSEGLHIAREVRFCMNDLFRGSFGIKIWDEVDIFAAGEVYIESLERALKEFDFAILIVSADDEIRIRGQGFSQARGNVIFELGLFLGALGRKRTFVFRTNESELHIPSDLAAISTFNFDKDNAERDDPNFRFECEKLGALILKRKGTDLLSRTKYFVVFPSLRDDPFYVHLLAGILSNPAGDKDMTLITPSHAYSGSQLLEKLDNLINRQDQFAGGIIAPSLQDIEDKDLVGRIDKFEIPIVIVDINPYRDTKLPERLNYVGSDNRGGGQMAAKEMAKVLGPSLDGKRVLVLGNDDQRDRHEGFIEAWEGSVEPLLERCRFNRGEARAVVDRKLKHYRLKPVGLIK